MRKIKSRSSSRPFASTPCTTGSSKRTPPGGSKKLFRTPPTRGSWLLRSKRTRQRRTLKRDWRVLLSRATTSRRTSFQKPASTTGRSTSARSLPRMARRHGHGKGLPGVESDRSSISSVLSVTLLRNDSSFGLDKFPMTLIMRRTPTKRGEPTVKVKGKVRLAGPESELSAREKARATFPTWPPSCNASLDQEQDTQPPLQPALQARDRCDSRKQVIWFSPPRMTKALLILALKVRNSRIQLPNSPCQELLLQNQRMVLSAPHLKRATRTIRVVVGNKTHAWKKRRLLGGTIPPTRHGAAFLPTRIGARRTPDIGSTVWLQMPLGNCSQIFVKDRSR